MEFAAEDGVSSERAFADGTVSAAPVLGWGKGPVLEQNAT